MKKFLLISILLFILYPLNKLSAQYVVELSIEQPAALQANAGEDISVKEGESVELGGNPTAQGGYGNYSYLWSPNTTLDNDTIANPTASPDQSTNYILTIKDSLQCTDIDTVKVSLDVTSIPDFFDGKFSIYPNPANNVLNIEFTENLQEKYKIELIDLQGKTYLLEEHNFTEKSKYQLQLNIIPAGVYIVQIYNSSKKVSAKIIIK